MVKIGYPRVTIAPLAEKMGYNTGLAMVSGYMNRVNSLPPMSTLMVVWSFSGTSFTISFFWAKVAENIHEPIAQRKSFFILGYKMVVTKYLIFKWLSVHHHFLCFFIERSLTTGMHSSIGHDGGYGVIVPCFNGRIGCFT